MTENEIAKVVVDSCIKVHKYLGPGLLESAYETCLHYELTNRGLNVMRQLKMPLVYEGVELDAGYRLDLLVEGKVVLEIKAVDGLNNVHLAQVLTYLKLSGCKLGFLLNFNVTLMKNGIKRVVNNL